VERRLWPYAATALLAVALIAIAFVAGRGSASDNTPTAQTQPAAGTSTAATKTVDGIPVGTKRTRVGALAAVDNYVALGVESVVQNPGQYGRLVREAYMPEYQRLSLDNGAKLRRTSASRATYAAGGRGVSVIGARRLDSYSNTAATSTSWTGFIRWGGDEEPVQEWQMTEVTMSWLEDRWRVAKIASISNDDRPAPAPSVQFSGSGAPTKETFDRELRGMTAPRYGG